MADNLLPDTQRNIDEGSTPLFTATLQDESGVAIPLANLLTLTLSVWNRDTNFTINGRKLQDAKNNNNVTVASTTGLISWYAQVADVAMQSTDVTQPTEIHDFRFDFTFTSSNGNRAGDYADYFVIHRKNVVLK